MNIIKVKVFDIYKNDDTEEYYKSWIGDRDISDFNMAVINKDGFVKANGIKLLIRDEDISEINKFVFDEAENGARQMLHSSTKKAKDIYDSCLRKEERFDELLMDKICGRLGVDKNDLYWTGDSEKCNLSPFGHCIYLKKEDSVKCIFCQSKLRPMLII